MTIVLSMNGLGATEEYIHYIPFVTVLYTHKLRGNGEDLESTDYSCRERNASLHIYTWLPQVLTTEGGGG